jgi:hypothetical protein
MRKRIMQQNVAQHLGKAKSNENMHYAGGNLSVVLLTFLRGMRRPFKFDAADD